MTGLSVAGATVVDEVSFEANLTGFFRLAPLIPVFDFKGIFFVLLDVRGRAVLSLSLPDTSVGADFGGTDSLAGLSLDASEGRLVLCVLELETVFLSLELEREYKDDLCCLEVPECFSAFFGVESCVRVVFEEADDCVSGASVSADVADEAEDIDSVS